MNKKLILASSSPRRKDLLNLLGLEYEIIKPEDHVEENSEFNGSSISYVEDTAYLKARHVADKIKDAIVIGADTIVVIDNQILGKPADEQEAQQMLQTLSDRWHEVFTGVAIVDSSDNRFVKANEISRVKFKKFTDAQIKSYIKTREPMDKAGSYALQGIGAIFVEKIEGCYTNIIGLPLPLLDNLLQKHFGFNILEETKHN